MGICAPREPVYYYECSAGGFRLVYFVPPARLRKVCRKAIADFPDGVDLGCTEADFRDFEELYGWRPPIDPEAVRHSFYALFSSTYRWKSFQGSGLIPARDLEGHIDTVAAELAEKKAEPTPRASRERVGVAARRKQRLRQQRTLRSLERLSVPGVDAKRDLRRQRFSEIEMDTKGDSAEQVFSRLHEKRRS